MPAEFKTAYAAGFACLSAWADLLDSINVFPAADGDTGRNLVISLTPLRSLDDNRTKTVHRLMLQARGNSGNIAARFFAGCLEADSSRLLPRAVRTGSDLARQAVADPLPGTMLTIFDALAAYLEKAGFVPDAGAVAGLLGALEKSVKQTAALLPRLRAAGVVDAGALGMYVFFDGFFNSLVGNSDRMPPIEDTFKGQLRVLPAFREDSLEGHCIDTVVRLEEGGVAGLSDFAGWGESVVMIPHQDYVKVHFHTRDTRAAEERIRSLGRIVKWSDDDLGAQAAEFRQQQPRRPIHIMTDAAGSLTRREAGRLGITLLDSYISAGDEALPETRFSAARLYAAMRRGEKVTTSQASVLERHQQYRRVLEQYRRTLYLCVGSVYTGNYRCALEWKSANDPEDRLTLVDTGTASGRLGVIAIAAARAAAGTDDWQAVVELVRKAVDQAMEFVFLDKLKYLAAGGRLSRPGAFLGDILHARPVITPAAEGAKRVGLVKNSREQLAFALEKLDGRFAREAAPMILLEYSDNRDWVAQTVLAQIEAEYPRAEILLQPLSLTSGVHMGPGTWGMAWLPELLLGGVKGLRD